MEHKQCVCDVNVHFWLTLMISVDIIKHPSTRAHVSVPAPRPRPSALESAVQGRQQPGLRRPPAQLQLPEVTPDALHGGRFKHNQRLILPYLPVTCALREMERIVQL